MNILIGYDGSESSDAALDDLKLAGLPREANALVVSVSDPLVVSRPVEEVLAQAMPSGKVMLVPSGSQLNVERVLDTQGLALKAADPLLCDRFVCKGEGLRQDELVVHLQQPIQHAGTSEWRIFFD